MKRTKRSERRSVAHPAGSDRQVPLLRICLLQAALLLGSTFALPASAQESRVPGPQYTDNGTDGCLVCHAGDNMTVMFETAHGNSEDPHAPFAQAGCEACHGAGSLHVSRARGGAGFPPLLRFRGDGDPVSDQLGACLDCHAEEMGDLEAMAWTGSLHDTGYISCSTCHEMHTTENLLATRDQQIDKCGTCHKEQISNHNRFESRGIVFDQLTCHTCHDTHQLMRPE